LNAAIAAIGRHPHFSASASNYRVALITNGFPEHALAKPVVYFRTNTLLAAQFLRRILTTASIYAAPNADVPYAASAIPIKVEGACYPKTMEQMTGH
jgi:hypothetical protein